VEGWPTGTVTFVFTDIVGSTPLVHALGDRFLPLLETHNTLLRAAWNRHRGIEVKTEGDSFFVAFADATDAIHACADGQRALREHEWPEGVALRVRMGMHTGEATLIGRDYLGAAVNVAARVGAAAHGDQILLSGDTTRAASWNDDLAPRALGMHGLRGLPSAIELHQLTGPGLPDTFPMPTTLRAAQHNLPHPPTELLGRETLITEIEAMLDAGARLVTLIGPGGIGKTRLALEVAHRLIPYVPGGVWFIEAAALTRADELLPAIAEAIQLEASGGHDLVEQIADACTEPTVLVLDNLEHLPLAGEAIGALLAGCATLTIITTSRSRVRLRAERAVSVGPLEIPSVEATTAADLTASAAGALLQERVNAIRGRAVDDDDARDASTLARRLDGIPLAIELAAARLDAHTFAAVLAGLDQSADVLSQGDLDLPERQRSMMATIRWSLDLLPASARALLATLSVFRGGASREALEALAGRDIGSEIAALEAASLTHRRPDGRIGILEPIRAVAAETVPDAAALERAHAAWFADLARRSWDAIAGPQQSSWVSLLIPEEANIEAAIARADPDDALDIASHIGRAWGRMGRSFRGADIMERCLDAASTQAPARARAWLVLGNLRRLMGDVDAARLGLNESIRVAQAAGDHGTAALARIQLGDVERLSGHPETAIAELEQAVRASEGLDARLHAMATGSLGAALEQADQMRSMMLIEEAAAAFDALGDDAEAARALSNLAAVAARHDLLPRAIDALDRAMSRAESLADPIARADLLTNAGWLSHASGDHARGMELTRTAISLYEAERSVPGMIRALSNLGSMLRDSPDGREESLALLERAIAIRGHDALRRLVPALGAMAAEVAMRLGQPTRALRIILAEDHASPDDGVLLTVLLAVAQARIGNLEGAGASVVRAASRARTAPPASMRAQASAYEPYLIELEQVLGTGAIAPLRRAGSDVISPG